MMEKSDWWVLITPGMVNAGFPDLIKRDPEMAMFVLERIEETNMSAETAETLIPCLLSAALHSKTKSKTSSRRR